jgi:hypothetical protein
MRKEYDFTGAARGALAEDKGKSRITIYLDNAVLNEFRARAEKAGTGYQTLLNEALRAFLNGRQVGPVTEATLRRIIREELPAPAPSRKRGTPARPGKSSTV